MYYGEWSIGRRVILPLIKYSELEYTRLVKLSNVRA